MKLRKLTTFALTSFLTAILPISSSFADQASEEEMAFREFSQQLEALSQQSALQPIVTEGARIFSVIAHASSDRGDGTDKKVIAIPEGWAYYTHSTQELSKRYGYEVETGTVRDPNNQSRIIEVYVKAAALSEFANYFKPGKGHRAWIDVKLDVVIVPLKS